MISKGKFISLHKRDLNSDYITVKTIGRGSSAVVYRVQNIENGEIFACKKIDKKKLKSSENLKNEIKFLKLVDHPNVLKLYDVYADDGYFSLITEECSGGCFFDFIVKRHKREVNPYFSERECVSFFNQLLSAVNYLHTHGICHRDLKPENMMLSSAAEDATLKIIDFGLSAEFGENIGNKGNNTQSSNKSNEKLYTKKENSMNDSELNYYFSDKVGTVSYMSPEVLNQKYTEKCDEWACGVILYMLLSGRRPFDGGNSSKTEEKIMNFDYNFQYKEFERVSPEAKNIIRKIFTPEEKRPSVKEMLKDEWVTKNLNEKSGENQDKSVNLVRMDKYAKLNLIQKSVVNYTAFHLNLKEKKKLNEIFNEFDEDKDGIISVKEFKEKLIQYKVKDEADVDEILELFNKIDVDKNKEISYNEFIAALMDFRISIKSEELKKCFKNYDKNDSGKISLKDLKSIFININSEEMQEIEGLFRRIDRNNNGYIEYDEFVKAFVENNKG